jgi:uncharacterized membrane protein
MMARFIRALAGQGGTTAIEMAVILPVLLLFVFGVTEFGRLLWTQVTLDYAAESAARCHAINETVCGTVEQTQTASRALGLDVVPSTFSVTTDSCGKRVSATLPFQFAVPQLLPYAVTIYSVACYPA